jgi:hypothetical protein
MDDYHTVRKLLTDVQDSFSLCKMFRGARHPQEEELSALDEGGTAGLWIHGLSQTEPQSQ